MGGFCTWGCKRGPGFFYVGLSKDLGGILLRPKETFFMGFVHRVI